MTSMWGGPGGPGRAFGGSGDGFNGNKSGGKPLLLLRSIKPPPGPIIKGLRVAKHSKTQQKRSTSVAKCNKSVTKA